MIDWNDAERRVERAHQLFEQRKLELALRELRAAVELNPYNPAWLFNLGLVLDEMGRYPEAVEVYQQAADIEPNDFSILYRLGLGLYRANRLQPSLEVFQKLEELDAGFEAGYCPRILIYSQLGDHERAEEMFYSARLFREQCPDCYYNIALSLSARGLYDKAIFCLTRALDLHGRQTDIHVRIAQVYRRKGDTESARRHYLADLRQNPGRIKTLLELGELLMEVGWMEEAEEKFRRAIELAPHDPAGYYGHGRWLLACGSEDESRAALEMALQLDGAFAGAHLSLARLAYRRGHRRRARWHLRHEMRLAGENPRLLLELSNMLMDAGARRAAGECLKRLVQIHPSEIDGWLNLAVWQFQRGHYAQGTQSCLRVLQTDPHHTLALYNLALASERQGHYETAMDWISQALARQPGDASLQRVELRLRLLQWRRRLWATLRQICK